MRASSGSIAPWAEWAWTSEPLSGEPECADRALVVARPGGLLAAVVDGLGHGALAVEAATKAIETIAAHAAASIPEVLAATHAALAGTRGAVMTLATLDGPNAMLAWAGVGDVEAVLHPAAGTRRQTALLLPGVIGDRIPRVREHAVALGAGDVLVLATDGLRHAFMEEPVLADPPAALAERILTRHARRTDDALALVVRYAGPSAQ